MNKSIRTLLAIHNNAWLIEPGAATRLLGVWEKLVAGEISAFNEESGFSNRSHGVISAGVTVAPTTSYDRKNFKGFAGSDIAVIPIAGPLMKADNCGDLGTASMRDYIRMAAGTASVKAILALVDSPGGTVDGTEAVANEFRAASAAGKKTVCVVDGMCCSAAYWIGSSCDEVYATDRTNMIGSIGTACTIYDDSKYLENKGIVLREVYATDSKDKNQAFEEARKGDPKRLVQEMLDPLNNEFTSSVKQRRGAKLNTQETLSGKVFLAADAQKHGLIDGIMPISQIINNLQKANIMNAAEFKAAHPQEHAAIVAEGQELGVKQERARVAAWTPWMETDPEGVSAAIKEGKELTAEDLAKLSAKAAAKAKLDAIEKDNAEPVETPAPGAPTPTPDADASLEANRKAIIDAIKGR